MSLSPVGGSNALTVTTLPEGTEEEEEDDEEEDVFPVSCQPSAETAWLVLVTLAAFKCVFIPSGGFSETRGKVLFLFIYLFFFYF